MRPPRAAGTGFKQRVVYVIEVSDGSALVRDSTGGGVGATFSIPIADIMVRPPRSGEWWTVIRPQGSRWAFSSQIIPPDIRDGWVDQLQDIGVVASTSPLKISFNDSAIEHHAVNASGQALSVSDAVVVLGIRQTWYIVGVLP